MTTQQYLFPGDSLTQGTIYDVSIASGGRGNFVELFAEALSNLTGRPIVGPGFRGMWLFGTFSDLEWTQVGGWNLVSGSNAYNKAPYGGAYNGINGGIATWTKPPRWRPINGGFCVYWIDKSGVQGNWSYRIDGGAWLGMNQTIVKDDSLNKFYVSTPVTSTVEFRANDGVADTTCCLAGIEPFFLNPFTTDGLIVHNIAANGARLHTLVAPTAGDPLAFVDTVKNGTGSPPSNYPNAGSILMHINDVLFADDTQWGTDLATFYTRLAPKGPVVFMNPWECLPATYLTVVQAAYRARTITSATSLGAKLLDHYAEWAAMGITGNAAMTAYGLLQDGTHESQAGQLALWPRIFWYLRQQLLGGLDGQPIYPAKATVVDPASVAAPPTFAATAGLPLQLYA